jgi:hypothetical protein
LHTGDQLTWPPSSVLFLEVLIGLGVGDVEDQSILLLTEKTLLLVRQHKASRLHLSVDLVHSHPPDFLF